MNFQPFDSTRLTTTPSGWMGIGTCSPSAKLHIVGKKHEIIFNQIMAVSRIAEETWEEFYDIYVDGKFLQTITRGEYFHNFLLVGDPENPDDWDRLIIQEHGSVGIGV